MSQNAAIIIMAQGCGVSPCCLQGLEDVGPDYLGTVKSNYLGTEFTAYEEWVGGQGMQSWAQSDGA